MVQQPHQAPITVDEWNWVTLLMSLYGKESDKVEKPTLHLLLLI